MKPAAIGVGPSGSGHFVKMVHNGIEYGDMQMICEAYHIMKSALKLSNDEIAKVFDEWNKSELNSYLIEITKEILEYENEDKERVVDLILDTSGQKELENGRQELHLIMVSH